MINRDSDWTTDNKIVKPVLIRGVKVYRVYTYVPLDERANTSNDNEYD
jgi:hypothetical protein